MFIKPMAATIISLGAALTLAASPAAAQFVSSSITNVPIGSFGSTVKQPVHFALGDLDHNGYADVMTADINTDTLSAILTGAGRVFTTGGAQVLTVRYLPNWIAIGNLNITQDKRLDVMSTASGAGFLDYSFGNGNGTFPAHKAIYFGPSSPLTVQMGDADLDGVPDAVMTLLTGAPLTYDLIITKGYGSNTGVPANFAPLSQTIYTNTGTIPIALAVSDINKDGKWDAAVAIEDGSTIQVGINNYPNAQPPATVYPTFSFPRCIALGDLDGDKLLDIAVACLSAPSTPGVVVYFSGNNYTIPTVLALSSAAWEQSVAVAIGDVTIDGHPDLVVAICAGPASAVTDLGLESGVINAGPSQIDVYPCVAGVFGAPVTTFVGGATGARWILLDDFDTDGKTDLALVNRYSNNVSYLWNTTTGHAGLSLCGTGTPGCFGYLGMWANSPPFIGNTNFILTCTNAPRNALGLVLVSDLCSCGNASDVFSLGIQNCIEIAASPLLLAFDIYANAAGDGATEPIQIPNDTNLVGQVFCGQSIFIEDRANGYACSNSFVDLVSSKCLQIVIQP